MYTSFVKGQENVSNREITEPPSPNFLTGLLRRVSRMLVRGKETCYQGTMLNAEASADHATLPFRGKGMFHVGQFHHKAFGSAPMLSWKNA